MSGTNGGGKGHEGGLENVVSLLTNLKKFEDSEAYTGFRTGVQEAGSDFYKANKGPDGNLQLTDGKAKSLADALWAKAVDVIATKYLQLSPEKKQELEAMTDPVEKKSLLTKEVRDQIGIDEKALYESLTTRGNVTFEELQAILGQVPSQYLQVVRGKMLNKEVKDMDTAARYNSGLKLVVSQDTKTFRGVGVPEHPVSVEQVKGAIGAAVGALPSNYGLVLNQYSHDAHGHKKAA